MSAAKRKGPVFDPGLCRCCGTMKKCRVLNVEYENSGQTEIYSDMFVDCFGLLLSHLDSKPSDRLVCATCVVRLRDALAFRRQVFQCEEAFLQMKMLDVDKESRLMQMEQATVEGAPKMELVKSEPQDDDDAGDALADTAVDCDYMIIKTEADEDSISNDDTPLLPQVRTRPVRVKRQRSPAAETEAPAGRAKGNGVTPAEGRVVAADALDKREKLPVSKVQQLMRERDPTYLTETNILTIVEYSYVCPFKCRHNHLLCYYCGHDFSDPALLREHTEKHHNPKKFKVTEHKNMIKIDLTRIDCRLCPAQIGTLDEFRQHIMRAHGKKYYFGCKESILPFKLTAHDLTCVLCLQVFPYFHALNKHMNVHFSNYVCETCGLGFVDKGRFVMHQQRHEQGDFPCDTCQKVFKAQYNRDLHIDRVHKKRGRVYCPKCDIKLMSYPQKLKHLVEVHGEAPLSFPCSMCDKVYETRRTLTIHRRKDHLKDYRYECQCCGQKFFTRFALNNHMPTHTGERNFKCKVCEKTYPRLKTLKDHMRIHTNDRRYSNILDEVRSARIVAKRRVLSSQSVKKELESIRSRVAQLQRSLIQEAPPSKHNKRKLLPKRAPCIMAAGSEPRAGPSTEPVAGPSSDFDVGDEDNPIEIEFIDLGGGEDLRQEIKRLFNGADNISVASEVEVSSRLLRKGPAGGKDVDRTIENWLDTAAVDSDIDMDLGDDTDPIDTMNSRDALTEPACTQDISSFQQAVLNVEDQTNDLALRELAPTLCNDFSWSNDETQFTGARDAFTGKPGPTFNVTNKTTVFDVFYRMIDDDLLDLLVTETNRYASQTIAYLVKHDKLPPSSRLRLWSPTDRDEMMTFLCILILQSIYPLPDEQSYFCFNGFGTMPHFRKIMSYNRFHLLKTMLHFVDNDNIPTDHSRLYKIQPVIDYFNKKFSSLYRPGQEIVIDESLLKWSGRLSFSQKIKSKAAQVGIKTYELCESATGYLWSFIVDTGKDKPRTVQSTNPAPTSTASPSPPKTQDSEVTASDRQPDCNRPKNATSAIVFQLVEPLLNSGHTLIMDNFYNSPLLARCLKIHKTDCFGTLRLSREFVPDALKTITKTDLRHGEVVASYCSDLSVMVWRDANLVAMISTYHPLGNETSQKHKKGNYKPNIVLDYNKMMGGVDRKDQFLSAHPLERTRNKIWYKKLFRHLFNVAILNSFLIYTSHSKNNISHRAFRTLLAEGLIKIHRRLHLTSNTLTETVTRRHYEDQAKCPRCAEDHFPTRTGSNKTRCRMCASRKVDARTIWKCMQCNVNLCVEGCFRDFHKQPMKFQSAATCSMPRRGKK